MPSTRPWTCPHPPTPTKSAATATETAAGIEALVRRILEHEPAATVLVCGPFPAGTSPRDPVRRVIDDVHAHIAALGRDERVRYVDLRGLFLDEEGRPNERMASDAIHLTPAGRAAWLEAIAPLVRELSGA